MKLSTYEEMAQVNTYILLPMSFMCGTFFSTGVLPEALRFFVNCLPLTHTSQLLRALTNGEEIFLTSIIILLAYVALGFFFCRRALQKLYDD